MKKKIRKVMLMAAVPVLLAGVLSGCGGDDSEVSIQDTNPDAVQVDIRSCMKLVPQGYNGGGSLKVEWDFSGTPEPLNDSQKETLENMLVRMEPDGYYKNGDKVEISTGLSWDVLQEQNLDLTHTDFTYKAQGFSYEVDPFEKLSLPIIGMDGQGILLDRELKYDTSSPFLQTLQFDASAGENLSNGDTITIKAIVDPETVETYGLKPTRTEKVFTVSGLGHPAGTIDELDDLLVPIGEGSRSRLLNTMCHFSDYAEYMPGVAEKGKDTPFVIQTCDLAGQYLGHIETEDPTLYESVIVSVYRMISQDPAYPKGRETYISIGYEAPPAGAVPTEWAQDQLDSQIYYKSYEPGECIEEISYLTADTPQQLWEQLRSCFDEEYAFTQRDYPLPSPEESFQNDPVNMDHARAPLYAGEVDGCYYVEGLGYIRNGIVEP